MRPALPRCQEWLSRIDVEVQGWWTWFLTKNDKTGKFYASDYKAYDEYLLRVQCTRCGQPIDRGVLEL